MKNNRTKIFLAFLLIYPFLLSGCGTVQLASAELDGKAKRFLVPADKSAIYVVRRTGFDNLYMSLSLDNKFVGPLLGKSYFALEVDPGKHTLHVALARSTDKPGKERPAEIELLTRPGQVYFVITNLVAWAPSFFKVVPDDIGKTAVLDSHRACTILEISGGC